MNRRWQQRVEKILVPIVVAILPFAPTIYTHLTDSGIHFVYQVDNERNPVTEWNRQMSKVLGTLESKDKVSFEDLPNPLLKKIGPEVVRILPALLSGLGVQPSESSKVSVLNVANQGLQNIRVHFTGCEGFDTYETRPDSYGSVHNPSPNHRPSARQITLRYDKLAPSTDRTSSIATLTYFGESTSDCDPKVEADLADGRTAVGKKESLQDYVHENTWARYHKGQIAEVIYKIFVSLAIIYLYFRVRRVEKPTDSDR